MGTHVFTDGVSQPGQPAMTCATALAEVQQAHDLGAAAGFWGADQHFDYRLRFLNAKTVDNAGVPGPRRLAFWGYSVGDVFATHDSSVVYFWDQPGLAIQLSNGHPADPRADAALGLRQRQTTATGLRAMPQTSQRLRILGRKLLQIFITDGCDRSRNLFWLRVLK